MKRFVVAEASMVPALLPGDGLLATRSGRARRGEIRIFLHPARPDMWLVKRVGATSDATFEAVSDNDLADVVDSRQFGMVPIAGSYRVRCRIPARWLR